MSTKYVVMQGGGYTGDCDYGVIFSGTESHVSIADRLGGIKNVLGAGECSFYTDADDNRHVWCGGKSTSLQDAKCANFASRGKLDANIMKHVLYGDDTFDVVCEGDVPVATKTTENDFLKSLCQPENTEWLFAIVNQPEGGVFVILETRTFWDETRRVNDEENIPEKLVNDLYGIGLTKVGPHKFASASFVTACFMQKKLETFAKFVHNREFQKHCVRTGV